MNLKKRKHFSPKKGDSFLMSVFLSTCFSFQIRTDLVLVKFFHNAAVRRFLKTFRKFAGKRLWWKPFSEKDSGKGVFLSVLWTSFYRCYQTLNKNAFLWITLFGANTPKLWKICQKVEAFLFLIKCPEILRRETFLFSLRANFTYFLKCIPQKKKKKKKKKRKAVKLKVSLQRKVISEFLKVIILS